MGIRVFLLYNFVKFQLALCACMLQHRMKATTNNFSDLVHVEGWKHMMSLEGNCIENV